MFSSIKHFASSNNQDKKRNIIFLFISIFIVFVIISTLTFYIFFNQVFKEFHIENMEKDQHTMNSNMNSLQVMMPKLAIQMLSNSDVSTVLFSDEVDVATTKRAIDFVSSLKVYNDVSSIVVYDSENQFVLQDNTMSKISSEEYAKTNTDFNTIIDGFNNGLNWHRSERSGIIHNTYTYVFQDFRGYTMLFGLSEEYFCRHLLQNTMHESYNIEVYYYNSPFMHTSNDAEMLPSEFNLSQKGSSFVYNSNLYVQSEFKALRYVTSISYVDILLGGLKSSLFIWFFVLIIFVFIIFAIKFFFKFYQQTVNAYLSNIKSVRGDMNTLKFNWLMNNLFDGSPPSANDLEIIKSELGTGYYRILIIQLDESYSDSHNSDYMDSTLLNYGIRNATTEILSLFGKCVSYETETDTSVFILTSGDIIPFDKLSHAIDQIQTLSTEIYSITVTVTVSHTLKTFDEFLDVASVAMTYSNYRYVNGYNSVSLIEPDMISNEDCDEKNIFNIYSGITSAINNKDFHSISHYLSSFVETVKNLNPIFIQNHLQRMFLYIMQNANDYPLTIREYEHLKNKQTLSEAMQYLEEILTKTDATDFEMNKDFLEVIEDIMAKSYKNPNYSINFIAEKFQISNTYAGKKFKQMFGCSFNSYLMEYRLSIATDMLKNTNKKISEIAIECGFNSDTYFVTSFKKMLNMTPTEYRNQF